MAKKLTQKEAESKFKILGFNLNSEYKGYKFPVLLQCMKCNSEWKANTKNILCERTGCPEPQRKRGPALVANPPCWGRDRSVYT